VFLTALARSFFLDASPQHHVPKKTEAFKLERDEEDVDVEDDAGPTYGRSASAMTIRSDALTTSDLNRSISEDHGYTLPPNHPSYPHRSPSLPPSHPSYPHPSPSTRAASRLSLARLPRSPSVGSSGHPASPPRGVTHDAGGGMDVKVEWSPDVSRRSHSPPKQSASLYASVAAPRPRTLYF